MDLKILQCAGCVYLESLQVSNPEILLQDPPCRSLIRQLHRLSRYWDQSWNPLHSVNENHCQRFQCQGKPHQLSFSGLAEVRMPWAHTRLQAPDQGISNNEVHESAQWPLWLQQTGLVKGLLAAHLMHSDPHQKTHQNPCQHHRLAAHNDLASICNREISYVIQPSGTLAALTAAGSGQRLINWIEWLSAFGHCRVICAILILQARKTLPRLSQTDRILDYMMSAPE